MNKTIIDDGFNAELVSNAFFDGIMEIPILEKPKDYSQTGTHVVPATPKNFKGGD